jgi:DNA ligase-1
LVRSLILQTIKKNYFPQDSCIRFVITDEVNDEQKLDDLYASYLENGYEGQMVRLNMPYEGNGKRSKGLMKRKEFEDAEFEIARIIDGRGGWSGAAKAVEFLMPDGRLTENGENPKAGIKGTYEFGQELLNNPGKYTHVTVRYFTATPAGIPRFGVAVAWHEDINNRG